MDWGLSHAGTVPNARTSSCTRAHGSPIGVRHSARSYDSSPTVKGGARRLNRKALKVGWASAISVLVVAAGLVSFLTDLGSVRTSYLEFADANPRLGWALLLGVVVSAAIGLTWQHRWFSHKRSDADNQNEVALSDLRQNLGKAEDRSAVTEVELADAKAQIAELREPKRARADIALVEEALGELGNGGRTRNVILGGDLECKYFDRWFLESMDQFRHEAPEALQRLQDGSLRDSLDNLYKTIEEFRTGMFDAIFSRRPDDPGSGDLMIVQPPEGPWASERPRDPWSAYYDRIVGMQMQLGQIRDALIAVERRLHQLRVDYC